MTNEGLKYMNSLFESLDIPYEFGQWNSPNVPDTYWVGEYLEIEAMNEDGMEESNFILTGTTNQRFIDLESVKQTIKEYITNEGLTDILESGSGIAVLYSGSQQIPSVQDGVFRIQVNLRIKEWRI